MDIIHTEKPKQLTWKEAVALSQEKIDKVERGFIIHILERDLQEEKRQRKEDWERFVRQYRNNAIISWDGLPDWKVGEILINQFGKPVIFKGFTVHKTDDNLVILAQVDHTLSNIESLQKKHG